jgi:hypothetical protein
LTRHDKTRQDKTQDKRQDQTRPDKTRLDKTKQGKARQDKTSSPLHFFWFTCFLETLFASSLTLYRFFPFLSVAFFPLRSFPRQGAGISDPIAMTSNGHELLGLESLQPHQHSTQNHLPRSTSFDYAGAAAAVSAGLPANFTTQGRKHSLSGSESSRGAHVPHSSSGLRLSFSDSNAGEDDCGFSVNSWTYDYDLRHEKDCANHLLLGPRFAHTNRTCNHSWKHEHVRCPSFRSPESGIMSVILLQPSHVSVQRTTVLKLLDFLKRCPSNCRCLCDIDAPWFLLRMMSRSDTQMHPLYMELVRTLLSYDMTPQNARLLLNLGSLQRQLRKHASDPMESLLLTTETKIPTDLKDLETHILLSMVDLVKKDVPNDRLRYISTVVVAVVVVMFRRSCNSSLQKHVYIHECMT